MVFKSNIAILLLGFGVFTSTSSGYIVEPRTRSYYTYASNVFRSTDSDWLTLCQAEKKILASLPSKHITYSPWPQKQDEVDSSLISTRIGSLIFPIPDSESVKVIENKEESIKPYSFSDGKSNPRLAISRSKPETIENLWGIRETKHIPSDVELTAYLFPQGYSAFNAIMAAYNLIPADLTCILKNRVEDSRRLFVLGLKTGTSKILDLSSFDVEGYVTVDEAHERDLQILSFEFLDNDNYYRVSYFITVTDELNMVDILQFVRTNN